MDFKKIAQEVLEIEAKELLFASAYIDDGFIRAVDIMFNTKGKVVVIGVGKSGLVGSKIAATLASTGTSSFFIHPTEAMHGDLGMIDKDDSVLAISYSGESEEIIAIIPHLKRFNVPFISMSKDKNSSLSKNSDAFLSIIVSKEACPLNIAPTSSTTLTMALGDALAVALMKKRGFERSDFASLHPGGSLGKKLFVKLKDIMRKDNLPIVSCETSLKEAIVIMSQKRLGSAFLTDENGKITAVLSDGDLRRAMLEDNFSINEQAIKYATLNPKICNDENMLASEALNFIEKNKIQILIVTNKDGIILGAVHIHDLVELGIK